MIIYNRDNEQILSVIVTQVAEHEEELMKSDFVKLSWNGVVKVIIPVDAYIIPYTDGIRYSLLEPYEPEQKSECEWHYEPQFQHPKMYLSKVTFTRPTKDSDANDINLLDWPFTGDIFSLLGYFCQQINTALGLTGDDVFTYEIVGDFNQNIVTATFNTQDILSALSNVANVCECEWHLDWKQKTLYFGRVMLMGKQTDPFILTVGGNISTPSVRNSKEGYWNAFEPQGSTRNITRRAASGEFVQANVRLDLRNDDYPDGIVYTDGQGAVITKEAFEQSGATPFIKSLIFEEVYPHLDLYAYNIRYRERYLLEDKEDPDSKVIDHYEVNAQGKEVPVYKKYAVWYMRLAWPEYTDASKKTVKEWHDYEVRDMVLCDYVSNLAIWEDGGYRLYLYTTAEWPNINPEEINTCTLVIGEKEYPDCRIYGVTGQTATAAFTVGETYATQAECRDAQETQDIIAALTENKTIEVKGEVVKKFNTKNRVSQVIDGKELFGQFKVNTRKDALSSPLAGRGDGDNGNYGFGLIYLGLEGDSYIRQANSNPTEDGDTGVIDMDGVRREVTDKDYEIVIQESGDYILPSTKEQLVIPKGNTYPSLQNNIVNLYNIVMDKSYSVSAKKELENETKKYIAKSLEDDNQYSFKTNPVIWERIFHDDAIYNLDSHLFIGQQVRYVNGENYTYENPLLTRVMKIVTKLDYDFEQEVTIGNEVIKSSTQSLKEQVQTLVSGGAGGAGGDGGMNESAVRRVIENWVTPRFLSKINDDAANGLIGFVKGIWIKAKGLFGWDEDGNITANNIGTQGDVNIGGNTDIKGTAKADYIQSHNYTGDGIADTGYLITADDNGSSKIVVDNLQVRKKATFEELEVKKETAIAGNQVYSAAANVINRTDYYDERGNLLGYENRIVPWLLGGKPHILNHTFYGRQKRTRIYLTNEDVQNISFVRCYFLASDGDRKVDNMWVAGDLARCQTMNLHNSERPTYIHAASTTKTGNVFWWRKVKSVSSQTVVLDDGKEYHYFDVYMNGADETQGIYNNAAAGSDIPAAGDHVVQFGNDTNSERMNLKVVEIVGDDASADKWYRGIYTFDLNKCWWGGNPRKDMISAAKGVEFSAPTFKLVTEYAIEPVPMDRDKWQSIPFENDEMNYRDVEYSDDAMSGRTAGKVRKCYYYDKVSHRGSYWLCSFTPSGSGYHWVKPVKFSDEAGYEESMALYDEDGVYQDNGVMISDAAYLALPESRKTQCGRLRDYTVAEPSEGADWHEQVEKGDNSLFVRIDGKDTLVNGQGEITLTAHALDGDTDVTDTLSSYAFSWERESSDHHADVIWNEMHREYGNVLVVNKDIVNRQALFTCVVDYSLTI